jgi:hypothetical protein
VKIAAKDKFKGILLLILQQAHIVLNIPHTFVKDATKNKDINTSLTTDGKEPSSAMPITKSRFKETNKDLIITSPEDTFKTRKKPGLVNRTRLCLNSAKYSVIKNFKQFSERISAEKALHILIQPSTTVESLPQKSKSTSFLP